MLKMRLIFKDENGKTRVEPVEKDKFVIGRHSECDLCISLPGLSRKHLQIERFGAVFVASDLGSSNGTTINGKKLQEPVALKNGDILSCGGVLELKVEIAEEATDNKATEDTSKAGSNDSDSSEASNSKIHAIQEKKSAALSVFILAPILGFFVLAAIGLFLVFTSESKTNTKSEKTSVKQYPSKQYEDNEPRDSNENRDSSKTYNNSMPESNKETPALDERKTKLEKIERYAVLFARQIALHEANYAFTKKQIEEISSRVDDLSKSAALANNLNAIRRNANQIGQMAREQGLKPQFLAIVVATQLGKDQGDVLKKAKEILPALNDFKISLGNELTDDNLLIVAALAQASNDKLAMRKTIEALSNEPGVDARKARTVWFLRERRKISDLQYEAVLKFLAIGAISQNPADFGVKAEPLVLQ